MVAAEVRLSGIREGGVVNVGGSAVVAGGTIPIVGIPVRENGKQCWEGGV